MLCETQFGNSACESAREAGSLRYGREVAQFVRALRGIHDSSGDRFDAETTDGRERSPAHGLRGEMGRELYGRERVDSLAALRKRRKRELIRGGARGSENQDFRLGVCGKERGGTLEEFRRGAATEQRASGHTQLLLARWARSLDWGLGTRMVSPSTLYCERVGEIQSAENRGRFFVCGCLHRSDCWICSAVSRRVAAVAGAVQ